MIDHMVILGVVIGIPIGLAMTAAISWIRGGWNNPYWPQVYLTQYRWSHAPDIVGAPNWSRETSDAIGGYFRGAVVTKDGVPWVSECDNNHDAPPRSIVGNNL